MAGEVYLYVDISPLNDLIAFMRSRLTPEQFDKLMRRSMNELGKRSKKPIRQAVQAEYYAPAAWVNAGIKSAIIEGGGGSIYCRIPLAGAKGHIGGTFSASGGHRGWNPPKYRITARIVKSGASTLPPVMSHQGGQPPFRNTAASGTVFTRAGANRLPVESVAGLALPQMPLNRASGETQEKLLEIAEKRVTHNFSYLFG